LITIEGIDGSGKSSLVSALRTLISDLNPVFTREPGATWVGDQVRRAVAEKQDPITEALLFTADHAAHLASVIRPGLAKDALVISDRYSDSRYAYQAITLEGHVPDPVSWLRCLHAGWTVPPDHTFLLVLPVDAALARINKPTPREHFEQEWVLSRVQENYLSLAAAEPSRFIIVDALKNEEEIHRFVADAIRTFSELSPSRPRR
jgi:dTMP kinase